MISLGDCITIIISIVGFAITITITIWQIREARRSTVASAFLSSINNRWQRIEEMEYEMLTEKPDISDARIEAFLDKILQEEFGEDLSKFADAFGINCVECKTEEDAKKAIELEILREYQLRDLIFNLCEEEYMAYQLKLIDGKLWNYWLWYIDQTFREKTAYYYWRIRRKCGITHEDFVKFVESRYYPERSGSPGQTEFLAGAD